LATLLTSLFYTPAEIIVIDLDDNRLMLQKSSGRLKSSIAVMEMQSKN
jgi:hypothetical protein